MGEVHEMTHFEDSIDVMAMDTDCDAHDDVLGSSGNAAVDLEEIGVFEGFEAEANWEVLVSE
jgi:hypothetical protein